MSSRNLFVFGLAFFAISWLPGVVDTASAANRYAVVGPFGQLLAGNGVTSVTYLGTGQYEVRFSANVSQCAYVATTVNGGGQAIQAYTAGGHLSANGVYVETKNQGGGLSDGSFHLVVNCGGTGMKYAVVGYTANLVRASAGTVVTPLGPGAYHVTFSGAVNKCAFIATVGDPGNALVFNPSGVYTASGPNTKTVLVETKNIAGGLSDGVPFHLAAICTNAPKTRIAVAGSDGVPVRASALTSTLRAATGSYLFATGQAITPTCATVATRGSTNADVPFTPATVEIVGGPAANTRGIEVRQLLFFGGALLNEAFHTATLCK